MPIFKLFSVKLYISLIFNKNTKKFKNLSYLDMNGTDVSVEVNLLAEAGLTDPADERPLFVVDRPDMLLQRALVGRRVLAERADEGFDIFVDVLDVSLLFADDIKLIFTIITDTRAKYVRLCTLVSLYSQQGILKGELSLYH
jgi:hypothetical protein